MVIIMIRAMEAKQISDAYINSQFETLNVDRHVRKAAAKGQKMVTVDDPGRVLVEEATANNFIAYLKDKGYEAYYDSAKNMLVIKWLNVEEV